MAGSTLRRGDVNQQLRSLSRFLQHPQYHLPELHANDIALVYWVQPLTFGATVRAIRLPAQNSPVPYGRNANVTGYGAYRYNSLEADYLHVVTLSLVTQEACNKVYNGEITADMLCAGAGSDRRGDCHRDTGGPLVVNGVQLGVVARRVFECARPGRPGIYARVPHFANWIRKNL